MASLLDDPPPVHHDDRVGIPDRGQPVGDHEARPAVSQLCHRRLDQDLGAGVDIARRLVENQDGRVGEERAGDRQQLLLPRGEVRGVLVEQGRVSVGQGADEVVDVRRPGGLDDLGLGRTGPPVGDVVPDRPCEQPGVLQHHAEGAPHLVAGEVAVVDAVEEDVPGVDLVEADEQVHDRGLACARGADDRDRLAGRRLEGEVLDQGLVGLVAERDVVEPHTPGGLGPPGRNGGGRRMVGRLLRCVQELEDPLGRGEARLEQVHLARDLGDRHGELARVLDERLHVAEGHGSRGDEVAAECRDHHVVDVGEERHRRLDDPGQELRPEARLVEAAVLAVELVDRRPAPPEHLHERMPGVCLLDEPVQRAGLLPLRRELDLRAPRDEEGEHDCERDRDRRHRGEQRRDPEHDPEHAADRQDRGEELAEALLQRGREVVDVVRDPAQDVAVRVAVEVPQRQPAELLLDLAAQPEHGALRDPRHDVPLAVVEGRTEQVHDRRQAEDPAELGDVDAPPRRDVHRGDHVGELGLVMGSQQRDGLLLGDAGLQPLAQDPVEQDVGRIAEDLRARHGEPDGGHAQEQRGNQPEPLGAKPCQQPPQRAPGILAPPCGRSVPSHDPAPGPAHHGHAAAASPSWETTISR